MPDERPEPVLVLQPVGRLDVDSCGDLRRQLAAAFAAGVVAIGIDLSGVTFVDRTGLDLLSGTARHLRKGGGALTVVSTSDAVASTLRINGLGALLGSRLPALRVVGGTGQAAPRNRARRLAAAPPKPLSLPG